MKVCRVCGIEKPETDFRYRNKAQGTRRHECNPCHNTANRQGDARNPGKKAARVRKLYHQNPDQFLERNKRWESRNKDRVTVFRRAAYKVRYALKIGRLKKPSECQQCGETERKIMAAHLDYSHPLDVRWLCGSCHRRLDQYDPKTLTSTP